MQIPQNPVQLALLGLAALLLIAGLVLFVAAVSFEGYIAALMVMALGGCCYAAQRELNARAAKTALPPASSDTMPGKPDSEA